MSTVDVLSNHLLRYWSALVVRRTSPVRSSPPRTIVGVRTPSYENTSGRCRRRLVGLVRRRAAVRFIRFVDGAVRFIRLPGGGGVARRLLIVALQAVVALRFVAFLIFSPSTTLPAICAPVVSGRFPSARAPRLISGATDGRRPLNKLTKPCPLWTRAPVKYGNAPPTVLCSNHRNSSE